MYIGSSWSKGNTNYDNRLKLGTALFLPAAGWRHWSSPLQGRDAVGGYWSSSDSSGGSYASALTINSGYVSTTSGSDRLVARSVRCVAE